MGLFGSLHLRGQRKRGVFFVLWGCFCISITVKLSANPITPSLRKWLQYLRTIGVMGVSICTIVNLITIEDHQTQKTYFRWKNSYKYYPEWNETHFIMILIEF